MIGDDAVRAKCSPRLQEAVRSDAATRKELQVMFRKDLPNEARDAAVNELARIAGAEPHMTFGIASVNAPVSEAPRIAALDGVEWIDIASEATLEELLDSE